MKKDKLDIEYVEDLEYKIEQLERNLRICRSENKKLINELKL